MSNEAAAAYLTARIGELAPSIHTLRQWARPSWRQKNPGAVRRRRIPRPGRTGKRGRVMWARAELDAYVDELTRLAEGQGRFSRKPEEGK